MARKTKTTQNTAQRQDRKANVDRVLKAAATKTQAKAPQTKKAVRKTTKAAQVETDEEDEAEEEQVSRSIVPPKFRARYAPNDDRCGDELSRKISEAICSPDEKGRMRVDIEKLRRLGEANGAWKPEYERLNPGQQRMTLGNRIRAKVRRGEHVLWVD